MQERKHNQLHVIQCHVVVVQQLYMVTGVDGAHVLRSVEEELRNTQEQLQRNLHMMDQHVHLQQKAHLNLVIQWVAVLKQQQVVEAMVVGVVALRVVEEELRREREHVLKTLLTMDLSVHHIQIRTLQVVIHKAAVVKQQQVAEVGEAGVHALRNVEEVLTREQEHAIENHTIMELLVHHIKTHLQEVVIQEDVAVVQGAVVVVLNVLRLQLIEKHVTKHIKRLARIILHITVNIVVSQRLHTKKQQLVGQLVDVRRQILHIKS